MRQTWCESVEKESKVEELSRTQNPAGKLQQNKTKSDQQVIINEQFKLFFLRLADIFYGSLVSI